MTIEHLAAFSDGDHGGNPAGVLLGDAHPDVERMQAIAADLGYSETAFAAPEGDGWHVRYFAPASEVPFCGHATIALGATLGAAHGPGTYALRTAGGAVTLTAERVGNGWRAEFTSPPARHQAIGEEALDEILALFGLTATDLAPEWPPVLAEAGARHAVLRLADRARLATMDYDLTAGKALMETHGLVTIALVHLDADGVFHARNAFASGGVLEDPATGAAAAAMVGWLRDSGLLTGPLTILQGHDMGVPCQLEAEALPEPGAGVRVGGTIRRIR
ncbi:PhzF family phenazine biosynthesis protein [Pontivivens ytuae]|uniref:PhzF family phenazine biosynthesis protein n=1 Tax=Pontivivens ytuae TaxID=2789856 RepID=A0A7S9LTP8_9RHOB|nr:PhzF family phenazine biosynthesis protein [Pontivivens ytuae]QPH55094.1 PhzF family phenazine biosynthesis protein [Pontivivens ytuae]